MTVMPCTHARNLIWINWNKTWWFIFDWIQDERAALFGRLRDTLTTSWKVLWGTFRRRSARLNVRTFASVRAGDEVLGWIFPWFFSSFWSIWLLTFSLKVLLSFCYLRPFDEGVPIEWGRQVRIWRKVLDEIEFLRAQKMINLLLWFLLTHTLFRFSQPGAYRVKQGSDYLENQCESRKCYITHVTFKCKINLL